MTVHAEDRAGHVFDATLTYTVTGYTFTGFAPPIENLPVMNDDNAGRSIPVKFSLAGFHGLDVFAQGYPKSQPIDCSTGAPTGAATPTSSLGTRLRAADRSVQLHVGHGPCLERHVSPADRTVPGRHREAGQLPAALGGFRREVPMAPRASSTSSMSSSELQARAAARLSVGTAGHQHLSAETERRRSRTYRAVGYTTAPVLKTGWGTGPMPLRDDVSSASLSA